MTDVTVILCTHGRTAELGAALDALATAVEAARSDVEVVIVDNAPPDGSTKELVDHAYPWCRYVVEERQGLGRARNRGLEVTASDIAAFVDDDVVVGEAWIDDLTGPIKAGTADLTAGRVEPGPGRRPEWMGPFVASMYFLDAVPGPTDLLIGASFAAHRRVFERVRFDPALGAGTAFGSGEDALFARQARAAGFRQWASAATARHDFDLARLEYRQLCRAAEKIGKSAGYVSELFDESPSRPAVTAAKLKARIALEPSGAIAGEVGITDREFDLRLQLAWCQQLVCVGRLGSWAGRLRNS